MRYFLLSVASSVHDTPFFPNKRLNYSQAWHWCTTATSREDNQFTLNGPVAIAFILRRVLFKKHTFHNARHVKDHGCKGLSFGDSLQTTTKEEGKKTSELENH
jgi:hypothetical protein